MRPHDIAHPAADTVSRNGGANMFWRDEPGSKEFQSVLQLLRPNGMGSTFKILIQHKGIDKPQLDGLRFKPFFQTAIGTPTGAGSSHQH